jgi:hypothetical protein
MSALTKMYVSCIRINFKINLKKKTMRVRQTNHSRHFDFDEVEIQFDFIDNLLSEKELRMRI